MNRFDTFVLGAMVALIAVVAFALIVPSSTEQPQRDPYEQGQQDAHEAFEDLDQQLR